jgi:HAE1 family hydrophobic/amphiphilic exporter-1
MGARESYDLVENEILPQIQQIGGIGETRMLGGQKREIKVNVDKDKLSFHNISLSQVTDVINQATLIFLLGKLRTATTRSPYG